MKFISGGKRNCAVVFDCITGTDVKHQVAVVCKRDKAGAIGLPLDELDRFLWQELGTRRVCSRGLVWPEDGSCAVDLVFFIDGVLS